MKKNNKLKKDNLLTIDKLYFALSFLLIAVAFLVIVFSKGKTFDNLFGTEVHSAIIRTFLKV